jgi:hypothetical protein
VHWPPGPQSELAQHAALLAMHWPMHRDWPDGHAHVPDWHVSPPVQSPFEQQLPDGMHEEPHSLLPEGHPQVSAVHVSPPPHPASAQQATPSVPHAGALPSDASLPAASFEPSLPEASLAVASTVPSPALPSVPVAPSVPVIEPSDEDPSSPPSPIPLAHVAVALQSFELPQPTPLAAATSPRAAHAAIHLLHAIGNSSNRTTAGERLGPSATNWSVSSRAF